jgi:hypothetical protein
MKTVGWAINEDGVSVCVCVCVRERERERESVCVPESMQSHVTLETPI